MMGLHRRLPLMVAATGVDGAFVPADIPQAEADALIAFYNATGGASWTTSTNWLVDTTVNNWHGITVAGGNVTQIILNSNNVAGAAGSILSPLTSLSILYLQTNSVTTLDVSAVTSLTQVVVYANSLSVLDLSTLTSLVYVRCDDNSISTLDLSALANGVTYIKAVNNGMNQAAVDSMISDIWTRRGDWTDATPELHVGGTNATPTGVYQDGYPLPLDALEEVHDLIIDDDAGGFQKWAAISWNGGSAP